MSEHFQQPTLLRAPFWTALPAYLLVVGSLISLAVGAAHRRKIDAEIRSYERQYGEMEVPQSFAFAIEAVEVGIPVAIA